MSPCSFSKPHLTVSCSLSQLHLQFKFTINSTMAIHNHCNSDTKLPNTPRLCLFSSEIGIQISINHKLPLILCSISFCRNHHHCHAVSTTSSPCCLEFQSAGHPSRRRKSQARASYLPSAQATGVTSADPIAAGPCSPHPIDLKLLSVSVASQSLSRKTQLAVQSPATQSCNSQPLQ